MLSVGSAEIALAQSQLPPVQIAPPATRPAVPAAQPQVARSAAPVRATRVRQPVRRAVFPVAAAPQRGQVSPPPAVNPTPPTGTIGQPPVPYAGGQVGTGARVGMLGNRSFLDTPYNLTGLTAKLMADQQALSVADVVLNDSSVRNDVSPFSDRDSYFIRGFSVTNLDTAFDGLFYLTNARRSFIEGIERVEILKGPSSFLNGGEGRIGGTINLVPKRATDDPINRVTTSYIGKGQFGAHVDIGRRFGAFNEWGVRFNGAYRDGSTALDKNKVEASNLTLGLDYRGDRFRASLDLAHSTQNTTAPTSIFNGIVRGIDIPKAPKASLNTASSLEYLDNRYSMVAARVEYDLLPNTTIYAAGGLSRYNEEYLSSFYSITNSAGTATNTLAIAPLELQGFSGEVGLRSQFETGFISHRINVSASHANNKNFSRGYFPPALPSFQTNIYAPVHLPAGSVFTAGLPRSAGQPLFTELHAKSIAVSDTLSVLDDRIQLTLGGRYQELDLQSYNTRPTPTKGWLASEYEKSRFSPAVGVVVKPLENLSIYANYIEALQSGPSAPTSVVNANQVFAPIVSKQKEVGAKYDLGTIAVSASLFEIEQPSALTTFPANFPTEPATFSVNGMQRNRGIELAVFGEPVQGLRLVGGITFIDAELVKATDVNLRTTANPYFVNVNGNTAPGVPTTAFNLYGEYDLPPWLLPGLTVTGRILYTSSQYYDQLNTQKIPDWVRVDAGLRYVTTGLNGKPITLRANVDNIFNESYWATASRGYLSVGAPRTFRLSSTIEF
ncbi:TonB-dependent receptor [Enterovirga rhinocerotis]|nr:TonB-dependent siderophore receptor [Enterovirga rhinocerotis]